MVLENEKTMGQTGVAAQVQEHRFITGNTPANKQSTRSTNNKKKIPSICTYENSYVDNYDKSHKSPHELPEVAEQAKQQTPQATTITTTTTSNIVLE